MFRRERRSSSALTWSDDRTFRLDDTEYVCRPFGNRVPSTSDRFCILKPRWSVLLYEQMLTELAPRNVVEVGIYDGGSTALFARLAQPQKLVAIDIKTTASPALEEYLDARRLRDTVATYYGVDQADTPRLTQILDREFGTEPLDLVIDDASHAVAPTRTTFDCLFPRLRPGATYLIEDWSWAHSPLPTRVEETPLTVLVFELILACANRSDVISEVTVNRGWTRVQRGPAELDDSFDVAALLDDRGRDLLANT
jgi:Methyltransferase domain